MELMEHKGYTGTVEVSMDDGVLHGKILHINDLVTYEGLTPAELKQAFVESVDDYLATCKEIGKQPEKPLTGQFNVRIPQELHRQLSLRALAADCSQNNLVIQAIEQFMESAEVVHNHHHSHNILVHIQDPYGMTSAMASAGMPIRQVTIKNEQIRYPN